jgi:hypothetical protein
MKKKQIMPTIHATEVAVSLFSVVFAERTPLL